MGLIAISTLTTNQTNVNATELNAPVITIANEFNGSIDNTNIAANAAIAYSKLNLSGSVLNADIGASAAIAFSKLAALTSAYVIVGNGSNQAAAVAMSGDVTITNAGVTAIAGGHVKEMGAPGTYHVSSSSGSSTTSTSYVDLTSATITFTPGHVNNPILILFSCQASHTLNTGAILAILDIGGNIAETERKESIPGANNEGSMSFQYYTTLAASSQTVKIQFKEDGGGTATISKWALTVLEFKNN